MSPQVLQLLQHADLAASVAAILLLAVPRIIEERAARKFVVTVGKAVDVAISAPSC